MNVLILLNGGGIMEIRIVDDKVVLGLNKEDHEAHHNNFQHVFSRNFSDGKYGDLPIKEAWAMAVENEKLTKVN